MRKQLFFLCFVSIVGMSLFQSCKKEAVPNVPPQVGIFYSIADKQVAFTGLTLRAATWHWDFGDGTTSTDKSPVHVYKNGGYYKVKLVGTSASGETASAEVTTAVSLTPYSLLTGNNTAPGYAGKKWKLSSSYSGDEFVNSDASFSDAGPGMLPPGIFGQAFGMAEVYEDTYTFYFDGKYVHDVKADGASFAGMLYAYVLTGGAGIVNTGGSDYGLITCKYTPQSGAKFTYVEKENFGVPSVYGPGGVVTYSGVSTLDFTGTEFIGFMDFQRKVIVQEITDNTMRLVCFAALSQKYAPMNTHALILTFDAVK
ncbi:MAG: PKD domain-containing protein [Mariniphaga sp.]